VAVILMYITVVIGAYVPLSMPAIGGLNPIVIWVLIMLAYSYIASTLPVTTLLQPRDYINAHQLFVALGLLFLGAIVAHPTIIAPAVNASPQGAPPIWPFLFVVIACGAISGFHSLVSSGTSAKQCESERDSLFVGYGSMLMEAALSTLVIVAVAAGIGLGLATKGGEVLTGTAAFTSHYANWASAAGLGAKLQAFVVGSANLMESYGIPKQIALTIMGVFLVSFAATTLDSATRIQRYVVGELFTAWKIPALAKPHPATLIAVGTAFIMAFHQGFGIKAVSKGALILWPLFGTVNQLLAALALLVVSVFLARRKVAIFYTFIPMVFMGIMTGWAMIYNLNKFSATGNWLLFCVGLAVFILEIWMIIETLIVLKRIYGGPVMDQTEGAASAP
jgi:carbon starvation protein